MNVLVRRKLLLRTLSCCVAGATLAATLLLLLWQRWWPAVCKKMSYHCNLHSGSWVVEVGKKSIVPSFCQKHAQVKARKWSIETMMIQVVDTFADARDRDILNLAEEMEADMEADKRRPICLPEMCFCVVYFMAWTWLEVQRNQDFSNFERQHGQNEFIAKNKVILVILFFILHQPFQSQVLHLVNGSHL